MKEAEAVCPWKTRTLRGFTAFRDAPRLEAEGRVTEAEGETVKLAKQNSTMSKKKYGTWTVFFRVSINFQRKGWD